MFDSNPAETFSYLARELSIRKVGSLHVVEALREPICAETGVRVTPILRRVFNGTLIANDGYDRDSAEQAVRHEVTDLISFGVLFLANPDLSIRFEMSASLNSPDVSTFYTGDEKGYADYPTLGG